jgi:S-adenosylmethionine decarboxylase
MYALGRQVLVEFYQCAEEVLNDAAELREILLEAVRRSGATIISDMIHTLNPCGVSGVIVIAESHVSIHTWPEYGYAAVDIFTCGNIIDPWATQSYLAGCLQAGSVSSMELKRGLFPSLVHHKPLPEQQVEGQVDV